MNKLIKLISLIAIISLISCNILLNNDDSQEVTIAFGSRASSLDISSITVTVEANDMDTVQETSTNNSITVSVPVGKDRSFTVEVTLADGKIISGSTTQDVTAGTNTVSIDVSSYAYKYLNDVFDIDSITTSTGVTDDFTLPTTAEIDGHSVTITWTEATDTAGNIYIEGNGYVSVLQSATPQIVTIRATATSEGATTTKDFDITIALTTKGIISGIMNVSSSPIENIGVALTYELDDSSAEISTQTNAVGFYSIQAEAGSYYVWLDHDKIMNDGGFGLLDHYGPGSGNNDSIDMYNVYETSIFRSTLLYQLYSDTKFTVMEGTSYTVNFYLDGY